MTGRYKQDEDRRSQLITSTDMRKMKLVLLVVHVSLSKFNLLWKELVKSESVRVKDCKKYKK